MAGNERDPEPLDSTKALSGILAVLVADREERLAAEANSSGSRKTELILTSGGLAEVRADKAHAAILDLAVDWTPAGKLRAAVVKTGQSPRTFANKASELVERGALERRGAGPNVSYRATGVFKWRSP